LNTSGGVLKESAIPQKTPKERPLNLKPGSLSPRVHKREMRSSMGNADLRVSWGSPECERNKLRRRSGAAEIRTRSQGEKGKRRRASPDKGQKKSEGPKGQKRCIFEREKAPRPDGATEKKDRIPVSNYWAPLRIPRKRGGPEREGGSEGDHTRPGRAARRGGMPDRSPLTQRS